MLWASHVLLWAQQMCLLETWLATRQPAKALPQISWPLSFQKAHYPMSWHASKVTNAYYYWRSFVFPFKFTAHSQNTLLSICSLLGFLYRSILCLILFELHFRHHQKLPPLISTFFQKTTSVGCSKAHTDIYDTSFLSYSMPFFFSILDPKGRFSIRFYFFWSDLGDQDVLKHRTLTSFSIVPLTLHFLVTHKKK